MEIFDNIIVYACSLFLIFTLIYVAFCIIRFVYYKIKIGLIKVDVEENVFFDDVKYSPAVMGYLVNFQKIGKNEIFSTMIDLIARNIIEMTLKKGFVSDDDSEYVLENMYTTQKIKRHEKILIDYLFKKKKVINNNDLKQVLYKKNLSSKFYSKFLKAIQKEAKCYDFFDTEVGLKKKRSYIFIKNIVRFIMAPLISVFIIGYVILCVIIGYKGNAIYIDVISVICAFALIFCFFCYLMWEIYHRTCYYNSLSKNGENEYRKWIALKKFLKKYSTLSAQPLMGVEVWGRYYAYSIGLKCNKKFFKQMKNMNVINKFRDLEIFAKFNDIDKSIKVSGIPIKRVSTDKYGGGHIDY